MSQFQDGVSYEGKGPRRLASGGGDARSSGRGGDGYPQKGLGENCGKRRDANGERESCVGSSVIRTITIAALFHPARHRTRRQVALHSRWFGRCGGRTLKPRQFLETSS